MWWFAGIRTTMLMLYNRQFWTWVVRVLQSLIFGLLCILWYMVDCCHCCLAAMAIWFETRVLCLELHNAWHQTNKQNANCQVAVIYIFVKQQLLMSRKFIIGKSSFVCFSQHFRNKLLALKNEKKLLEKNSIASWYS